MTPQDLEKIKAWAQTCPENLELTLVGGKDEKSLALSEFCDELAAVLPNLDIRRKRPERDDDLPAIIPGDRLRYHAAPDGPELPVFLSALAGEVMPDGLSPKTRNDLTSTDMPALFQVFIAPQCPFCPETVRRLLALVRISPGARMSVIDAALFPEVSARHGVQSVPTVILDDQFRWTGGVELSELANVMCHRDPAQLSAQSLLGVIEDGKSEQVVQMMVSAGKLFPSLYELLTDEKWPIRLGAMVTLESVAAAAPDLGAAAVSPLLEMLRTASDGVRGDLLYLLGEIGGTSLIPELRSYQAPACPEAVREAATDAIDAITARETTVES